MSKIPEALRNHSVILPFIILFLGLFSITASAQLSQSDIEKLKEQAELNGWTFKISENPATEYSLDQLCGLKVPDNWQEMAPFDPMDKSTKDMPEAFDWRDSVTLPAVKNQGGCGGCWAFATVAALECNILLKDGITVDLSEQWLISCNQDGWGCGGGWWAHDYHWYRTDACGGTGSVWESDFTFVGYDASCNCPYDHEYMIDSWSYVGSSYGIPQVDAMKNAILNYGPITVGVHANNAMQSYGGGIFNGCYNGDINHGVVLVGWDDTQGTNGVWIMRNSWGPYWGEEGGYMRMEYGCSMIGYGAAYINYAGSPKIEFSYLEPVPDILTPDQPDTFTVEIVGMYGGNPVPGTARLHYSIDDGAYQIDTLDYLDNNQYDVIIPGQSCGSKINYYVSVVDLSTGERIYDPDTLNPNRAIAAADSMVAFAEDGESDLGWFIWGSASDGTWERGIPAGDGTRGDPTADYDGTGSCYLTGNRSGDSDVDDGSTYMISPTIDLSSADARIRYARWYSNDAGGSPNEDVMEVFVSNNNGSNWTSVEVVGPEEQASGGWFTNEFLISDYVTPTDQVKIRFDASDLGDGSVVEAAVDDILITSYICNFICGDANGDGAKNLLDITYMITYLYNEGPEPIPMQAADCNGDGTVNLLDISFMINFLYNEGPEPVC